MSEGEVRAGAVNERSPGHALHLANPLGWLLAPTTSGQFFADYFERAPLVCSPREPRRYDRLLTLQAVDAFAASMDLRHDMVQLVAAGHRVDPGRYVGPTGRVQAAAVAEAYQRGATIILPQLQLSMEPVADFCRALEGEFSAPVQANAYLTPAQSQGFEPHYDQHDVFILQIAGAKTWRLYASPPGAAGGAAFERGRHEPGAASAEFALEPGDCLYIPRGLMHEASNLGGEPSLHLTVGVFAKRWADLVLDAVAALVRADPAFHDPLPPGFATRPEARRAAEQRSAPLAARIADGIRLDEALDRLAGDFLRERRPAIAGVLAGPRPHGRLRRRSLLLYRLGYDGNDVVLTGPGGDLRFARGDEAALGEALSGAAFDVADLNCPDPRLLAERLWANGYLEQAPERAGRGGG